MARTSRRIIVAAVFLIGAGAANAAEPDAPGSAKPLVSFSGQYRINSYSVDNDVGGDNQTASRVRIRQGIDFRFDKQFYTHLQFELGHTTGNVGTTSNDIKVRHAVLNYDFNNGVKTQAGIVPLSDLFGDTLFSSDWDYNPVAVAVTVPMGRSRLRAFAANLGEGDESISEDDFVHYQIDFITPFGSGNQVNFGLTMAEITDGAIIPPASHTHVNYGVGFRFKFGKGLFLNGFVLGSSTDNALLGTTKDADGVALKLELTGSLGRGNFGVLLTHASGESDGSGFLPVMALAKTNGYWGYTGLLTVQGPTDTGFDGDSVNLSNNGYGLTTVQFKYSFPITSRWTGYAAAGWFGNSDTPVGRSDDVGTDAIFMGTYRFNKNLTLDAGVAYARLEDGLSGYSQGVIGGTAFNQAAGTSRSKNAVFMRLQAEF